jgi:hypothetical protein
MDKNHVNNFEDDLPPDLEDIPEEVLPKKSGNTTVAGTGNVNLGDYAQPKTTATNVQPTQKEEKKKQESFGGFKKGFFSAESKPKTVTQPKKEKQEIIEVKPTQKKDSKVLDEVQEAMKANQTLLDKKQEWMTPDFLTKIATNPKLTKLFTNPEYMQAITIMQKNPQEAMQKYGNNPEFRELLIEFSTIMGQHFEVMGEKSASQTTQETGITNQPRDPKAEELLNDPKVKSLIMYMQKNPKLDFQRVVQQDPELSLKIKYLIDKGYFQINSA